MDPVAVIQLGMSLYAEGKLEELKALVHPEAEIQMALLHDDVARGPEGLEQALRAATHLHAPRMERIEPIDDHAAVLVGRVRYPLDGGGFADRPAAWLDVLRDGLVWRVRLFSDVRSARQAYEDEYRPLLLRGPS